MMLKLKGKVSGHTSLGKKGILKGYSMCKNPEEREDSANL
jgi:hypothetical protein